MRIADGFMLCEVAGEHVVVPFGAKSSDFRGMMKLNSTGKLLWDMLTEGAEEQALSAALVKTYGVDEAIAAADAADFIAKLREIGCLK